MDSQKDVILYDVKVLNSVYHKHFLDGHDFDNEKTDSIRHLKLYFISKHRIYLRIWNSIITRKLAKDGQ